MAEFAKAIDKTRVRHYLIADTEDEINSYCEEKKLEILNRPKYVDPTMVCHHFIGWAKGQDLHSGKLETNNLLGELE